jgi:hypothetical protein
MGETCSRCGSSKQIPNIPLPDRYGDYGQWAGTAALALHGNPQAWFRKDTARGDLALTICGECGHADLKANNHRELYEKYLRSIGRTEESEALAGNELDCLSCGATIPSGGRHCPQCGWSWKTSDAER